LYVDAVYYYNWPSNLGPYCERHSLLIYSSDNLQNGIVNGFYSKVLEENGSSINGEDKAWSFVHLFPKDIFKLSFWLECRFDGTINFFRYSMTLTFYTQYFLKDKNISYSHYSIS